MFDACRTLCLLSACAALLLAAEPAWKTKAPATWTAEEAAQVLTASPWAVVATAPLARIGNEDERRDSGDMGRPRGIGFDGVGSGQIRPKIDLPTVLSKVYTAPAPESIKLLIRWETALPIRLAELKAGEIDPPTLEGNGYKIAVYGIPATNTKGDPKSLGDPLKKNAVLRRDGKKDVKPLRVEVFRRQGGLVVVYLFPLEAEIGRKDAFVDFEAQIGRIVISQSFEVQAMQFQGNLEL